MKSSFRFFSFIGCICLITAASQWLYVAPEIDRLSPYSDALIYQNVAQFNHYFGSTHMTYRVLVPVVAGGISHIIGQSDNQRIIQLIFALLNCLFFTGGIYFLGQLVFAHLKAPPSFIDYWPFLLLLSVPFFWRSAFLPLLDTAAFFMTCLIFLQFERRNAPLLFLTLILAVFTKEIILLTGLAFPLIDLLKDRRWPASYLMVISTVLIYLVVVLAFLPANHSFYLFSPAYWVTDWHSSLDTIHWKQLRFLPSALGLIPVYAAFKIYKQGFLLPYRVAASICLFFFIMFWFFTPSNSPRLMFMVLPFIYLFIRH